MNKEELVEKIINKAVKGGWLVPKDAWNKEIFVALDDKFGCISIVWDFYQEVEVGSELDEGDGRMTCDSGCCGTNKEITYHINDIIFDIDFAKAYWGEDDADEVCFHCAKCFSDKPTDACICDYPVYMSAYEYHTLQLFLAEDRLKYLEKFLNK